MALLDSGYGGMDDTDSTNFLGDTYGFSQVGAQSGGLGDFAQYTSPQGLTTNLNQDAYNAMQGTPGYGGSLFKFGENGQGLGVNGQETPGMTGFEMGQLGLAGLNSAAGLYQYFDTGRDTAREKLTGIKMQNEDNRAKIDAWKRHDAGMRRAGLRD